MPALRSNPYQQAIEAMAVQPGVERRRINSDDPRT
jgi:hypothetical protein